MYQGSSASLCNPDCFNWNRTSMEVDKGIPDHGDYDFVLIIIVWPVL